MRKFVAWFVSMMCFIFSANGVLIYRYGEGGMVQMQEVPSFESEHSAEGWMPLDDPLQLPSDSILRRLREAVGGGAVEEVEQAAEAEPYRLVCPPLRLLPRPECTPEPKPWNALLETGKDYCNNEKIPLVSWKRGNLVVEKKKGICYHGHCCYHLKGPIDLKKEARRQCPFLSNVLSNCSLAASYRPSART